MARWRSLPMLLVTTTLLLTATVSAAPHGHEHGTGDVVPRHGSYPSLVSGEVAGGPPGDARDFELRHGSGWHYSRNPVTGSWHRIYGRRGSQVGVATTVEEARAIAEMVLAAEAGLLAIDPGALRFRDARAVGDMWAVLFEQTWDDLVVRGSRIEVRFHSGGALLLLGADVIDTSAPSPLPPFIDEETARSIAAAATDDDAPTVREVIYTLPAATGVTPVRGYETLSGTWQLFINGDDGGIDYARSLRYGVDVLGSADGFGSPGLLPDTATNPPVERPLPFLDVYVDGQFAGTTDANGNFDFSLPGPGPVTVTATLDGPFATVTSINSADLFFSGTFDDGIPGQILFNDTPTELATAQVNAFIAINESHSYLATVDPAFTDMDYPVPAVVNFFGSCDAFWALVLGGIITVTAGAPCPNTAYSSVIYHEYSHAIAETIYGAPLMPVNNLNEGFADAFASHVSGDPVIGADFFGPGTFVRNVDTPDAVFPDDITGGDPHLEGLIVAGAFWDLRTALIATLGATEGDARAGFLLIGTLQLQPDAISPELTTDVLMVDDDDGDLSNGTPHEAEILAAFSAHGLGMPVVGEDFLRGDGDGDGAFNGLADGLFLLAFAFQGGAVPPCMESADVDGNGAFNALVDVLFLLAHGFQGGVAPPAPYPDCGADPLPGSSLGCAAPPAACNP